MIDRRSALLGGLTIGIGTTDLHAQSPSPRIAGAGVALTDPAETIDLWPAGAPGKGAALPAEAVDERSTDPAMNDRAVHGISRPRMVVFRPTMPNGAAALVMPGGGYRWVVVDKEGYEIARWLAARGWTVFVLFYRLPGESWKAGPDVALSDAQRAIRLIRAHADRFKIKRDRIVAMGFSAGGHVCGDLATRFAANINVPIDPADRESARPDLAAPIYAVQSMRLPLAHAGSRRLLIGQNASRAQEDAHTPARNVDARTPPTFLVHAEDDQTVDVANTLEMRAALRAADVSVETHLFAQGGHGFGLRRAGGKPAQAWPALFVSWANSFGIG